MAKNKIRVGSRAWAEQRARDTLRAKQEGNHKKRQQKEERRETWDKEQKEQKKEKQKEQKEKEKNERKDRKREQKEVHDPIRKIYLEILGLTSIQDDATSIKTAYRQLALQFHPDKNTSPDAESKMKAFNEAYEFLTKQ